MKRTRILPLGWLAATLAIAFPMMAAAVISTDDLRCDYQTDPLGIDSPQPRLSWTLQSGQRGDAQTAYRILVASSPALLTADTGDLWDSGKVVSTAQNQIPYGGTSLAAFRKAFWKVRVWDANDTASPWSAAATWTMGALDASDWTAQWITLGQTDAGSTMLRRDFAVGPNLKRALVNICGLGQYELFLNGTRVGSDFLSPGWTRYDKTVLYDTHDVTSRLASGANGVGIMLGNGMYNVPNTSGRYLKFSGSFGPRKVIAQLRLEYNDGSVQTIGTDAAWKATADGPITFNTIYGGEDYDARREMAGWDTAGFNASAWSDAVVTTGPGGVLRGASSAAPPLRKFEVFTPSNSWSRGTGNRVYDFGQNAAQIPTVTVHGPAGSTIRLYPSELVDGNGDINPIVSPAYYTYTLKGDGAETFTPRFCYIGYRYLRVERRNASGGTSGAMPVLDSISSAVVSSASPEAGSFSCSNTLFNRIRMLIKWAQRSNAQHVITDCPQREKLGWLEQYYLHGPSLRYEQDFAALFSKCAVDMEDSQLANGLVPDIAPEYTVFGGGFRDSPEWGSAFILSPWQQLEFYGDREILSRHYAGMKAYLDYLTANSSGHIVNYGLGDWFDLGPGTLGNAQLTPVALTATATYYADAVALSQIAALLGNPADQATYAALAANIHAAFNARFANADGSYSTGSQTANAMPLVLGLVPPANREKTRAALLRDVRARGNSVTAGDIGHRYLLRALADAGRSDVVFDLHSKSDRPGYGYILGLGATSLTEGWDGSASQNHFMLGHITEWFYHDLAGIQPDPADHGFGRIIVKPAIVGDVTWAEASYDSIRGTIRNRWDLVGNQMTMTVNIPVGATATVWLPMLGSDPGNRVITEGGTPIWQNGSATGTVPGVVYQQTDSRSPGQSAIAWEVGSGEYQFAWTIAPTPAALQATASTGRVDLAWNAAVSATGYKVKRATVSGGPYTVIATGISGTSFTDLSVTNGITYHYVVSATSGPGESLDSYPVSASPSLIIHPGFESPAIGTYQYGVGGAGWTFSPASGNSGSGISANGSGFTLGNPAAPEGMQVAFLQGTGVVSQTLTGLLPGAEYAVTFMAAQRNNVYGGQVGQTWDLSLDGAVIGSYAPPQSAQSYAEFTASFTATASSHTLAFVGTNLNGGDNTVFLDDVRLAPAFVAGVPRDLTWDNGAGSGNWNTTEPNWNGSTWNNANPDNAIFGSTAAGPVTLTEAITVNNITFSAPGYTISGNTLTIGSAEESVLTTQQNAVIGSNIGGGSLRKAGSAKFTLDGSDRRIGNTVIEGGILEVTSTGKLYGGGYTASPTLTVETGATLRLNGWSWDAAGSIANLDYGRDRLVVNGGIIEYTGSSNLNPGDPGSASRNLTIGPGGATLKASTSTGQSWAISSGNGNLINNGVLTLDGDGSGLILKVIEGIGSLAKKGSGSWTLRAANTYTGDTSVLSGTLGLGDGNANTNLADLSSVTVAGGAMLDLNYSGTDTVNALSFAGIARPPGIYSAANSGFITGPGTLTVSTGPATDYAGWAAFHALTGGPDGDDDHDGLTNFDEYAFGLDPESGASARPLSDMIDPSTGTLNYTRRRTSLTGLGFSVWTSTDLGTWTEDTGASQTATAIPGTDNEAVGVVVSPGRMSAERLFVRLQTR